ncbi:nitroreductase family protein [Candidatus Poribacteria bacterium]|nr:nitroreductase family protein [Candidatus Poribacteria bacterium]
MDIFIKSLIHNSDIPVNNNKILKEDFEKIISVARWAPSPFNSQPWEFIVIEKEEHRNAILKFINKSEYDEKTKSEIIKILLDPPLLYMVLYNKNRMDPGKNADTLGLICLGACLGNISLSASEMGIKLDFFSFSKNERDFKLFLNKLFNLPENIDIVMIHRLSYLADKNYINVNNIDIQKKADNRIFLNEHNKQYNFESLSLERVKDSIFTIAVKRKSYRKKFLQKKIFKNHINTIIESAFYAPHFSKNNSEKWKLILVENKTKIGEMAELIHNSASKLYMNDHYYKKMKIWMRFSREDIENKKTGIFTYIFYQYFGKIFKLGMKLIELPFLEILKKFFITMFSKAFFYDLVNTSPMLIGLLHENSDEEYDLEKHQNAMMSIGAALQNILLTVTYFGMGAQFLSILFDVDVNKKKVIEKFNLPKNIDIVDMIRIGYIDPKAKPPQYLIVQSNVRQSYDDIIRKGY